MLWFIHASCVSIAPRPCTVQAWLAVDERRAQRKTLRHNKPLPVNGPTGEREGLGLTGV
jgi:hypothetical protein